MVSYWTGLFMFWVIGGFVAVAFFSMFAQQYRSLQKGGWYAILLCIVIGFVVRLLGGLFL